MQWPVCMHSVDWQSEVVIFSNGNNRGGSQNVGLLAVQLPDMTDSPRNLINFSHRTSVKII